MLNDVSLRCTRPPHAGLASAQKVTRLTPCSTDNNQLRIDCKYELAADSQETAVCKYTQGDRTLGATDPDEPKDAAYKNRVTVSLVEKNICLLSFDNLPDGKHNYTCNIIQKETVSMTTVVDKSELVGGGERTTEWGGFIPLMQSSV